MDIRIALAGNPNCGKTTLFNALTGLNQYVGNWPGVTVEKKEGNIQGREGVIVTDLPGIYSLSPYSLEEVVARNYLVGERPDAILNIVDGTNLERNLYLTNQLSELGIPVVIAINMMDIVKKRGDIINTAELSKKLGCKVFEISALKEDGILEAADAAIDAAKHGKIIPHHNFSGEVEHAIAHIEEAAIHDMPEEQQRWYAIKIFERDEKVLNQLNIPGSTLAHIEADIKAVEKKFDDDAEGIITNERYLYIDSIIKTCYRRKNAGALTTSDKIDKIVTNRWLGLPVFAFIMFMVYYISMVTVGTTATDWANNGLFGNGWHLFGYGASAYSSANDEYIDALNIVDAFLRLDNEGAKTLLSAFDNIENADREKLYEDLKNYSEQFHITDTAVLEIINDEDGSAETVTYTAAQLTVANETLKKYGFSEPNPASYGIWVMGVPVLIEKGLDAANSPTWLNGLILDGIVAGVGGVLGFVPQMLVLFLMLAFLESCGYMARIAFVLDRVFRKFGLSGKSFIPILVGTGCGVPGIMASRTIENIRDRRMTIITTTFIPCGAKVPFISMIAGAVFGGSPLVATSAYFIGMAAIIVSGLMLKNTRLFSGDPAPFVMELPSYHMPTLKNVLRSAWERGWSFIKKAGTVILLSTMVVWFATYFGFVDGKFRMLTDTEVSHSILAYLGGAVDWIFKPIGFGTWQAAVASLTGLIAKENIVGSMSVLYSGGTGSFYENFAAAYSGLSAYSFLVFNLLCAPCFAAIGAISREMNSAKWTAFALIYQCGFAYAISLFIYQFGLATTGTVDIFGFIFAVIVLIFMLFMLMKRKRKVIKE
jgi:ferrous iron transport protein B